MNSPSATKSTTCGTQASPQALLPLPHRSRLLQHQILIDIDNQKFANGSNASTSSTHETQRSLRKRRFHCLKCHFLMAQRAEGPIRESFEMSDNEVRADAKWIAPLDFKMTSGGSMRERQRTSEIKRREPRQGLQRRCKLLPPDDPRCNVTKGASRRTSVRLPSIVL
jgi:hypothetical protein